MSYHPTPTLSRLSLRANFSWTFVGSVVYAASQWGMIVLLTKLTSPETVGEFALGLAITTPIMAFATLKTRLVQATDTQQAYLFGDYLGLRLITTALALLATAVVAVAAGYAPMVQGVIIAVGGSKAVESIGDVIYGRFQQQERMDYMAQSKLLKGPLALLGLWFGLWATGQLLWGVISMSVCWLVVVFGYDLPRAAFLAAADPLQESIRPRWQPRVLGGLAWLALPLGVVVTLESLVTNIPRYFVEQQLGVYLLGIFAAMAYLKRAGSTLVIALGLAACPRLAQQYAAGERRPFSRLLIRTVGIGAVLGGAGVVVAWLWGRPLLTLLYRPEYAAYQDVFMLLIVANGVDYVATFLDYGITAARRFRQQMVLYIVMVGTAVFTCAWLIPAGGMRGAAIAMLVAVAVRAAGSALIVFNALRPGHMPARRPIMLPGVAHGKGVRP